LLASDQSFDTKTMTIDSETKTKTYFWSRTLVTRPYPCWSLQTGDNVTLKFIFT